ncbi:MAG: hypothetical protein U0744_01840 [Gemmataceae bacterium]
MAGFVEVRGEQVVDMDGKIVQAILKAMTDRERSEMFNALETVGNIRIDRAAFAIIVKMARYDFDYRITGKSESRMDSQGIEAEGGTTNLKNGVEVHYVGMDNVGSIAAIIGDSDFPVNNGTTDHKQNWAVAAAARKIAGLKGV